MKVRVEGLQSKNIIVAQRNSNTGYQVTLCVCIHAERSDVEFSVVTMTPSQDRVFDNLTEAINYYQSA